MAEPLLDPRDGDAARAERAAWTRDIAAMLRQSTGVAPELRPGYLAAAEWLDPAPCCPEFARTRSAHTEICPGFERNDPARAVELTVRPVSAAQSADYVEGWRAAMARACEVARGQDPLLGLATTRRLLEELVARGEVDSVQPDAKRADAGRTLAIMAGGLLRIVPEVMLEYRTVDS